MQSRSYAAPCTWLIETFHQQCLTRHMLTLVMGAYSSASLEAQEQVVTHTHSPLLSPSQTMCAGLRFSDLVSICGQE